MTTAAAAAPKALSPAATLSPPKASGIPKLMKEQVPPSPARSTCSTMLPDSSDDLLEMLPDTPTLEAMPEMPPRKRPLPFVAEARPTATTDQWEAVMTCLMGAVPSCCMAAFGLLALIALGGALLCVAPALALARLLSRRADEEVRKSLKKMHQEMPIFISIVAVAASLAAPVAVMLGKLPWAVLALGAVPWLLCFR